MSQLAARRGDKHICPLYDGTKPHIGGEISECVERVLIEGQPAAVVGSKCDCKSPSPNTIISGSSKVIVAGYGIARTGDSTSHGGRVIASGMIVFAN